MRLCATDPGAGVVNAKGALQTGTSTVCGRPACGAGTKGQRRFVTDASATTFHITAAGGGADNVAVTYDGTNWYISANDDFPIRSRAA